MIHQSHQAHQHTPLFFRDMVSSAAVGKTVAEIACEAVPPKAPGPIAKLLTPRERQVFAHMLKGMSNKEIAIALDGTNQVTGGELSSRTVEDYRERIKTKLGVKSSTEAVMMGIREIVGDDVVERYIATLVSPAS